MWLFSETHYSLSSTTTCLWHCAFPEFIWKKAYLWKGRTVHRRTPGAPAAAASVLCAKAKRATGVAGAGAGVGGMYGWWRRCQWWSTIFCRVPVHLIMGATNHVQARKDAVFIREHCCVAIICQIHTGCSNLCAKSMYMWDIRLKEWLPKACMQPADQYRYFRHKQ